MPINSNVLELPVVRFETVVYRNATNKDTMFMDFCKAKIIVPAKRPLLQKLCCLTALLVGAVTRCKGTFSLHLAYVSADKTTV